MKILHVSPHLGGGVGKAHAAISAALPDIVEQSFVLLEPPRERRFVDAIETAGARVLVAGDLEKVAALAREADIVQFEFWNHPRMFECLARCDFPPLRAVFWSHISGLFRPVIQPGLMQEAGRFVFTTEASLALPGLNAVRDAKPRKIGVINSGFGFADSPKRKTKQETKGRTPSICYLGTADFVKMHPGFFDAIDRVVADNMQVMVWGVASEAVISRMHGMQHRDRIRFCGETTDPAAALAQADIFFYPLQADHYGTSENALVEAMSLGLVPVVLGNPAEKAIIRDGETGFVADTITDCVSLLEMLLLLPDVREKVSDAAMTYVADNLTPAQSALDLMILWLGLIGEPARQCDFRAVIGDTPADWYLATQRIAGAAWVPPTWQAQERAAKGTLAHFEDVFAGDASFARLRTLPEEAGRTRSTPQRERIPA
jgi:hypothetical protein